MSPAVDIAAVQPESARVRAMQLWFRLVIVWFVALALPVQGIAAVTMAHCGPGHDRMAAENQQAHHAHEAAGATMAHHDDAAAPQHADPAEPTGAEPAKPQPPSVGELAKYKCSSCAACCAGAALPSSMPRMPEPVFAAAAFADRVITIDPISTAGPDRPPRP